MRSLVLWVLLSVAAYAQNPSGVPTIGFTGGASVSGCGGATGYAHQFTLTIPQQTGASTDLTSTASLYYAGVSNFAQTGSGGLSQTAGLNDLIFCTDGTPGATLISYIRVASSYISTTGVVQLIIGPIPSISHTTTTSIYGYIGKAADSDHSCGTSCTAVIPSSILILPMGSTTGGFAMTDYAGNGSSPTNHSATGGNGQAPPFEFASVTAGNWFNTGYGNTGITGSFTIAAWVQNSSSASNNFVMGNIATATVGVDLFVENNCPSGGAQSCLFYQIAKDNSNRASKAVSLNIGQSGTWFRMVLSYTTGGLGAATMCINGTCTAPGSQINNSGFPIGSPGDPGSTSGAIQMFAPGAVAAANWIGALDEVYWINGVAWSNDLALWDYNNESQQTVGTATFTLIS